MTAANKRRTWGLLLGVAIIGFLYLFWIWVVERVEVAPGYYLVKIHRWGKNLPEDTILAPDESYKGVQKDVLQAGRYFLNPIFWSYEVHKLIEVPPGQCLVLTRKFGKEIPAERLARGEILAAEDEKGIVEKPLGPGKHPLNPYAYEWKLENAIEIKAEQVGVRTLKVGKDPRSLPLAQRKNPYVVPVGYRGVQEEAVTTGTYYINSYVESIVPVELKAHRVDFTDIEFPSRDGFTIRPHVLVTYKVLAEHAPELLVTLTDEGLLHQEDATPEQQKKNEILQKVVLPLIRGYVRLEGSKYQARDFVSQTRSTGEEPAKNPRERLQEELMAKVKEPCQKVGIIIESITLAQSVTSPDKDELIKLADIIAERERARLTREQNKEKIEQYKKDQETKAAEALSEQNSKKVAAQTKLEVEQKKAQQRLEVEEAKLKQELTNAKTRLEAAKSQARATLALGEAEAFKINQENEAEVAGLKKKVESFPSVEYFAQYQVLSRLAPALSEIFASDSSDFAKLFAAYMAAPANKQAAAPANGGSQVASPNRP